MGVSGRRLLEPAKAASLFEDSPHETLANLQWEGLRLKAELEIKGVRHPVRWACRQKVNSDGSLTLRHNYNPQQPLV